LLETALFASSPYFAKGFFYSGGEWMLSRQMAATRDYFRALKAGEYLNLDIEFMGDVRNQDLAALLRLATEINVMDEQSIFKFYHFRGAHTPFNINREGEHHKTDNSLADYREFVEYKLYLMAMLIEILQKSEIYDNSMIVFTGDHGSGRTAESKIFRHPQTGELLHANLDVKARATPFLAVKFPGRRGTPDVNNQPVSLGDVSEMILSGGDQFVERRTEKWVRRYFHYRWHRETREYLDQLKEYFVTDHAWLDEAWTPYHIHGQEFDPADCFFSTSQNRDLIRKDSIERAKIAAGSSFNIDVPDSNRRLFALIEFEHMSEAVYEDHHLHVTQSGQTLFSGGVEQLKRYQESIGVEVFANAGPLEVSFDSGVQGSRISLEGILWLSYDACERSACGTSTREFAGE
jgi:hypothetical protein